MKRTLIALLLALSMMMTLAACGAKEEASSSADKSVETVEPSASEEAAEGADSSEDAAASEEETPAEEEPGETEVQTGSQTPIQESKPAETTKPAQPAEQKPAQSAPVEQPAQSAPAQNDSVDLTAFYETLAANGGENWPMMAAMEGEALDAFYPGLTGIATKQCGVYMPMISAVAAEIALIEVENAADVQAVKDILQSRVNYQVGDETNPGGAWYPESIESWKVNSRIVSNGNCVMLVVMDTCEDVVAQFNGLF